MQWRGRRQSFNVEDRRSMGGFGGFGGFGGGGFGKFAGGGIGAVILFLVIALISGQNPLELLQITESPQSVVQTPSGPQPDDEAAAFVKVVLADNEDIWRARLREVGKELREPRLVLFRGATQSGCGFASAASGPFYCSEDERIYIDLSFYDELHRRFRAPGDFAMAYVIAHEFGHHIQHLLGTLGEVHRMRGELQESEYNRLSVNLELQADFYAGVWAHYAQQMQVLEPGDVEEALNAASAIGDDRLQMQAQGYVVPESFTHGTSEQRMYWFKKGFQSGDISQGNTFRGEF